jgi:hypothetical protein
MSNEGSAVETQLLAFIQKYFGVANSGDTAQNKGQCVGLIECWIDTLKHPHIVGNAVDLMQNAMRTAYQVVENGPSNYPPAGAILCWDGSWGGGYGHTAIVVAASPMAVAVFEQNDPTGAAPLIATHSYGGVAGWIVPK